MLTLPDGLSQEQLALLAQEPTQEDVTYREGGGGNTFTYLEAHSVIAAMNEIFGPDGWSHDVNPQFNVVAEVKNKNGDLEQVITATCTVSLYFASHTVTHTDVGIGTVTHGRYGPKLENFEKAYKEAATDAFKRAVRVLGNRLGNSLYQKDHPLHKGGDSRGKASAGSGRSGSSSSQSAGKSTGSGSSKGSSFNASPEGAPAPNGKDGSYVCEICDKPLKDSRNYSAAQQAMFSTQQDGRILHLTCRRDEQ